MLGGGDWQNIDTLESGIKKIIKVFLDWSLGHNQHLEWRLIVELSRMLILVGCFEDKKSTEII